MKPARLLLLAMPLIFGFAAAAPDALAQCINCRPSRLNPDILVCAPSSSGGQECQANDGACVLSSACPGSGGPRPPVGGIQSLRVDRASGLDASVIKDIAKVHPRFAFALAFMHKRGLMGRDAKVFIIPRVITQTDVDEELGSSRLFPSIEGPMSLRDGEKRMSLSSQKRPAARTQSELVIYSVSIEEVSDSLSIIKLQVETPDTSDPAYSVLEIELTPKETTGKWEATNWRIR